MRTKRESGMTLIEVLAVIVLISMIMLVVGRNVFGKSGAAKAKLNQVKMKKVCSSLGQYRLEYNKYPATLEELVKGPGSTGENGQIFTPMAEEDELKDIWDFPFVYRAENNGRSYVLMSLGADGVEGGTGEDQDVTMKP